MGWSRSSAALALGAVVLFAQAPASGVGSRLNTQVGEVFPDMAFDGLLAEGDYAALGLPRSAGAFHLSEVPGDLLLLEFFNRYCLSCQRQAPYLNSFYEAVTAGDLKGRVRILSVGVGNRAKDVEGFRQQFKVGYPIAADPMFDRLFELGDPGGTPFSVFLLRRGESWVLADFHLGVEGDTETMARVRVLLEGGTATASATPGRTQDRRHPPLSLNAEEQKDRARIFLSRVAGAPVSVQVRQVADGVPLFEAVASDGRPTGLFARIGSRDPVCDVCHAIHFFYAFDLQGTARGFEPIHVTKYGNALWNPEESARMERTLVGRRLGDLRFDPELDAVTRATMSSALIFDEVRRAADLLAEVRSQ